MDFYGNFQKTLEFVLAKYISIGFPHRFSRFLSAAVHTAL